MRLAKNIRPGMTVLQDGAPSLVLYNTPLPNGKVLLNFFSPNAHGVLGWVVRPCDPVEIAPLAPTAVV